MREGERCVLVCSRLVPMTLFVLTSRAGGIMMHCVGWDHCQMGFKAPRGTRVTGEPFPRAVLNATLFPAWKFAVWGPAGLGFGPCWSGVPGLRLQSANTPFLSTDDEIDRHARQTGGQDDPSQDLLRAYYVPATAHPLTPVISSTTHTCSGKKNVTSSNHICR